MLTIIDSVTVDKYTIRKEVQDIQFLNIQEGPLSGRKFEVIGFDLYDNHGPITITFIEDRRFLRKTEVRYLASRPSRKSVWLSDRQPEDIKHLLESKGLKQITQPAAMGDL